MVKADKMGFFRPVPRSAGGGGREGVGGATPHLEGSCGPAGPSSVLLLWCVCV